MNIKYVLINYNYSIPFAFQLSKSIFIIVIITIDHDAEQRQSRVFGTTLCKCLIATVIPLTPSYE